MIYIQNDKLVIKFPELHPNAGVEIDFKRTLRLPDDGKEHHLPPGFGSFPLRHIEDYDLGERSSLKARGGVIMPMFQADALWINFNPLVEDYESVAYPIAVKIGTGKICAVSGNAWSEKLIKKTQNYIVVPDQPWLDGYNTGDGVVRQFVAAPLGDGVTVEEQIANTSDVGGIQIQAFPLKRTAYDKLNLAAAAARKDVELCYSMSIEPNSFMGLSAGGQMRQEIYEDEHAAADWDKSMSDRCFVTIANAKQWMEITGEEPPVTPVNASDYSNAGLPWFEYYDADKETIKSAAAFGKLKSFQHAYEEKDNPTWSNETLESRPKVISLGKREVLQGNW